MPRHRRCATSHTRQNETGTVAGGIGIRLNAEPADALVFSRFHRPFKSATSGARVELTLVHATIRSCYTFSGKASECGGQVHRLPPTTAGHRQMGACDGVDRLVVLYIGCALGVGSWVNSVTKDLTSKISPIRQDLAGAQQDNNVLRQRVQAANIELAGRTGSNFENGTRPGKPTMRSSRQRSKTTMRCARSYRPRTPNSLTHRL